MAVTEPATLRWGFDGWKDICERRTTPSALGLHTVEVDTSRLKSGRSIDLTYRLEPSGEWIARDYRICGGVAGGAVQAALAGEAQA